MSAPVKLWRYVLPSINGEGWAVIVLGSDGFFAAVSDWGNYAFIWRAPGVDDFRKFLLRASENWDYFAGKLGHGGGKEYDEVATLREFKAEIVARRREGHWTAQEARKEWDLIASHDNLDTRGALDAWAAETAIEDCWQYIRMRWDYQLETFCKQTLGRLADMIRADLAAEAA